MKWCVKIPTRAGINGDGKETTEEKNRGRGWSRGSGCARVDLSDPASGRPSVEPDGRAIVDLPKRLFIITLKIVTHLHTRQLHHGAVKCRSELNGPLKNAITVSDEDLGRKDVRQRTGLLAGTER